MPLRFSHHLFFVPLVSYKMNKIPTITITNPICISSPPFSFHFYYKKGFLGETLEAM